MRGILPRQTGNVRSLSQYDSNNSVYVDVLTNDPTASQKRNYSDQGEVPEGTGGWAQSSPGFRV